MSYEEKYYALLKESDRVYGENIEFRRTVIDLRKINKLLEESSVTLEAELKGLRFQLMCRDKTRKIARGGLKIIPFPMSR